MFLYKQRANKEGNGADDLARAIAHGEELIRTHRLEIDKFPERLQLDDEIARRAERGQLIFELKSLAETYAQAGLLAESRERYRDALSEAMREVHAARSLPDEFPADDKRLRWLFSALSETSKLAALAGDEITRTDLNQRAQAVLHQALAEIEAAETAVDSCTER